MPQRGQSRPSLLVRKRGMGVPADSILSASVTRAQPSNWIITAMSLTSPKLWVVATPLGNPGDLSPRAREVLEGADMVLAEDTRRAGLLCQRCGVKAKRFMSFHDHNEESKLDEVLGLLNGGRTLAAYFRRRAAVGG